MSRSGVTNYVSSKVSILNQIPINASYKTKFNKPKNINVYKENKSRNGVNNMGMSMDIINHKKWAMGRKRTSYEHDVTCASSSSLVSESEVDTETYEDTYESAYESTYESEKKSKEKKKGKDGLDERVVSIDRVSKTVKGGRKISFRAVIVVGDGNGKVGVGNASSKEIAEAVDKAKKAAKKKMISFPLTPKAKSFPHRVEVKYGACKVMLRPAVDGTGVIAGGAVRIVLEMAGVKNGFGKQLRSGNLMNNAKATIEALRKMKTFKDVANDRDVSLDFLLGKTIENDLIETGKKEESETVNIKS